MSARPKRKRSIPDRFWLKVGHGAVSDCWMWQGSTTAEGYGQMTSDGRQLLAHRVSWEIAHAKKIPAGLTIDHLCRNRGCVNPDHLEAVTDRENILRGAGPTALNAKKDACPKGHSFDAKRTTGQRRCRICDKEQVRARRAKYAGALAEALARADKAFVRGASWAYAELTGALIVPASFEEKAREARAGEKEEK